MVSETGKYSKKIAKLYKLRDVDSFTALVEKLIKATQNDLESLRAVLKASSINAARLKLWPEAYSVATQFISGSTDQAVIKVFGEAVYHTKDSGSDLDVAEARITSLLRSSGLEEALDDADLDDLKALKSIPSIPSIVKRRVRNRKHKYPRGFDPEKPGPLPDPERWLPKNQRTKQVKNSKRLATGFQGGSVSSGTPAGPSTAQKEASKDTRRRRR